MNPGSFSIRPAFVSHTPVSIVEPRFEGEELLMAMSDLKNVVDLYLPRSGALLFRNFKINGAEEFGDFVASFGSPLLKYEYRSTPRNNVQEGVYTASEYPAHQNIPLHNEMAYTREWPMKLWFYCILPSRTGGQTPVADSRAVFRLIAPAIRERFENKKLMYVRNYGNGLDLPWEVVFNTEDRKQVEAFCQQRGIDWKWKLDGGLWTRQICQAVAMHPGTGEAVWFNQAHLFHISSLEAEIRDLLLEAVVIEDLPRNVYYGDGSEIEENILNEIREVVKHETCFFDWQIGDVMLLDNMLCAHGRRPYQGPREVIVAMSEAYISGRI